MAEQHSSTRLIAPSRRPDGTLRKEIKVKPGFKSEELDASTRTYKSRGTQLKEQVIIPPSVEEQARLKHAAARAARRQRAKERKQTGWDDEDEDGDGEDGDVKATTTQLAATSITPASTSSSTTTTSKPSSTSTKTSTSTSTPTTTAAATTTTTTTNDDDLDTDPAKLIKKLTKKIREIEKLQSDATSGRILTSAEQEKVSRLAVIQKQIDTATARLNTS